MPLTANDIRNFEFTTQMRGYSREEVDDLMEQVAKSLESGKEETLKLQMELDQTKQQLVALKEQEEIIKSAAIDARRHAGEVKAKAEAEAEEVLTEAKEQAERLVGNQEKLLQDTEDRVKAAQQVKKSYLEKVTALLKEHLEQIEQIDQSEFTDQDAANHIEVTASSEVDASREEFVGGDAGPSQPAQTEEAHAASKIVVVEQPEAPTPEQPTQEPNTVGSDTQPVPVKETPPDGPTDPELVAALKNYQGNLDRSPDAVGDPAAAPPTFITKDGQAINPDTGKIPVADAAPEPQRPAESQPVDPDRLAEELDQVVAQFEEEMDKAAKSE